MANPAPQDSSTTPRHPLRWILAVLALLVVGGAITLALLLSSKGPSTAGPDTPSGTSSEPSSPTTTPSGPSQSPSDDPTGTPTDDPSGTPTDRGSSSSPTPTNPTTAPTLPSGGPTSTAPGELAEDEAAVVVDTAITAPLTEADTADALATDLADVAVDGYASELEAQWLELTSQGWSVTGTPTIASTDVTDVDSSADPVTAQVLACIDSSGVAIVDADGEPVGNRSAAMPRALHSFTMIQDADGTWRISDHSFPDNPSC